MTNPFNHSFQEEVGFSFIEKCAKLVMGESLALKNSKRQQQPNSEENGVRQTEEEVRVEVEGDVEQFQGMLDCAIASAVEARNELTTLYLPGCVLFLDEQIHQR